MKGEQQKLYLLSRRGQHMLPGLLLACALSLLYKVKAFNPSSLAFNDHEQAAEMALA